VSGSLTAVVITTGAGSRFSSRLCGSSAHSSRTRPTSRRSSRRPSRARLAITDPDCLARYAKREQTHREHAGEIQHVYGYRDFSERTARTELSVWLDARAWTTAERPSVLFDLATARLIDAKVRCPVRACSRG